MLTWLAYWYQYEWVNGWLKIAEKWLLIRRLIEIEKISFFTIRNELAIPLTSLTPPKHQNMKLEHQKLKILDGYVDEGKQGWFLSHESSYEGYRLKVERSR